MKKIVIAILFIQFANLSFAQTFSKSDLTFLKKKEDSLKTVGLKIIQGINASDRFFADSAFTRIFVRALKTPYSFSFAFDSIINVSKLYSPDSSFRIFTWQLQINENIIRQHGAIQMKTADGKLKLFRLTDRSDITKNMADTIANNDGWMGAVYYKMIEKKIDGKPIYTLFGFDANNIKSDKKIVDILEFVDEKPVFGKKIFYMLKESNYPKNVARFIMEFKKEAAARLTYDATIDAIVFDELISESNQLNKKWTLIPDGEQEGFKWKDGKWIHFNKTNLGTSPANFEPPKQIRDKTGKVIEDSK